MRPRLGRVEDIDSRPISHGRAPPQTLGECHTGRLPRARGKNPPASLEQMPTVPVLLLPHGSPDWRTPGQSYVRDSGPCLRTELGALADLAARSRSHERSRANV